MIRMGIVDDHAIVRRGLREFLSTQVDMCVVGEAANGREAVDLIRREEIDVLIMDIYMPEQSGMDALSVIRAKAPHLGVLILSGLAEEQFATHLLRMGASGYLSKTCDLSDIVEAARTIALGRRYLTPSVAELLVRQFKRGADRPPHEQLSDRELQVFLKIAAGETNMRISNTLSLSSKTVTMYRSRVMEKMALGSNSDATYYAVKNRLLF
jgi:two-component system invasion response regulator UvrY